MIRFLLVILLLLLIACNETNPQATTQTTTTVTTAIAVDTAKTVEKDTVIYLPRNLLPIRLFRFFLSMRNAIKNALYALLLNMVILILNFLKKLLTIGLTLFF